MGYDAKNPMKDRITDIGPRDYKEFLPPVIKRNFGTWLYHDILEPGVLMHVSESGEKVFTVRVGGARLMSVTHIREYDIADKHRATSLDHPQQHRVCSRRRSDKAADGGSGKGNSPEDRTSFPAAAPGRV
jgi:hypothetical protein